MINIETDGRVRFTLFRPGAHRVVVAGSFTDWDRSPWAMQRSGEGWWWARIGLAPGEYLFSYLIDGGTWLADYAAFGFQRNPFGGWVSCLVVVDSPRSRRELGGHPTGAGPRALSRLEFQGRAVAGLTGSTFEVDDHGRTSPAPVGIRPCAARPYHNGLVRTRSAAQRARLTHGGSTSMSTKHAPTATALTSSKNAPSPARQERGPSPVVGGGQPTAIPTEYVRARAYEIFLYRSGTGRTGDATSDWLQAEREVHGRWRSASGIDAPAPGRHAAARPPEVIVPYARGV